MKKILMVYYSQTGQLARLAQSFARPLQEQGVQVDWLPLEPQTPYAFPWKFATFFDTFPETVHLQPPPIAAPVLAEWDYDVVVLAYTVWFLSPAQPITAFLQHPAAARLMAGKAVITLIGCRNMWLMAQETVKQQLQQLGATLIGNIVKIDACGSMASFVTTPVWLLTGKKHMKGWPAAGIAPHEIDDVARFGARLAEALSGSRALDTALFRGMGAVRVNEKLIASEKIGKRSFLIWGRGLMAAGRISPRLRRCLLYVYAVFLVVMILTVVPVSAVVKTVFRPCLARKTAQEKAYFAAPSGE